MRPRLLLAALLALTMFASAQNYDKRKIDLFATAISHAEGFGERHAIPTRYHNPGDIKSLCSYKLAGQKSIGKGGHIVFKNDAAGWFALKDQIAKMIDGRSKNYNSDMTFKRVARNYASNWRSWLNTVSKELGVEPDTTLREYFEIPPVVIIRASAINLPPTTPSMPVLAE